MVIFAISNSFKITIITVSILNMILGLANYYLVQFRNLGILAVDITNITTAVNVSGEYSYKWRFFSLVPLILAILLFNFRYVNSEIFTKLTKVKYFKSQETILKPKI